MTHLDTESRDLSNGTPRDPEILILFFALNFQLEVGGRGAACKFAAPRLRGAGRVELTAYSDIRKRARVSQMRPATAADPS